VPSVHPESTNPVRNAPDLDINSNKHAARVRQPTHMDDAAILIGGGWCVPTRPYLQLDIITHRPDSRTFLSFLVFFLRLSVPHGPRLTSDLTRVAARFVYLSLFAICECRGLPDSYTSHHFDYFLPDNSPHLPKRGEQNFPMHRFHALSF
jgi:hypothetical protein